MARIVFFIERASMSPANAERLRRVPALRRPLGTIRRTKSIICHFCHQDVIPCHDLQEMRHRAMSHVVRCEKALKDDLSDGINPSDGQSAGSI
jgi:hypothetical protein